MSTLPVLASPRWYPTLMDVTEPAVSLIPRPEDAYSIVSRVADMHERIADIRSFTERAIANIEADRQISVAHVHANLQISLAHIDVDRQLALGRLNLDAIHANVVLGTFQAAVAVGFRPTDIAFSQGTEGFFCCRRVTRLSIRYA